MTNAARFSASVLALSLVAAACSSGGDERGQGGEEAAGVTVTSSDGVLSVFVPDGAGPSGITVEKLDALPEAAVADSDFQDVLSDPDSGVASLGAYSLGPDGATFDEPVTIEWRTDIETDGSALSPAVAVITTPAEDGVELLNDLTVAADGDVVVVRGTTTHFSAVESFNLEGGRASGRADGNRGFLRPPRLRQQVGESTEVEVELTADDRNVTWEGVKFTASPTLRVAQRDDDLSEAGGTVRADVECRTAGSGDYKADVTYTAELPFLVGDELVGILALAGEARCEQAAGGGDGDAGGGDEDAVAAGRLDPAALELQCYEDARAPCSSVTWNDISPRVGVSLDDLPGDVVTLSVRYSAEPALPDGGRLESRAFGTTANWVIIDSNGTPVGAPGPDIEADLAGPSLRFDLSALVAYVQTIIGGPLVSLTPVEVTYSDADGNVGGGVFGEAAQSEGRDWIAELIETLDS